MLDTALSIEGAESRKGLGKPGRGNGMGIILILAGIVGIVVAIFGKEFYSGDILSFAGKKPEQRIPTWFGRSIFIVVGVFFIFGGIKLLLATN